MTREEFAAFCANLAEYFGQVRQFSQRRLELYYDQVGFVPAEALGWIERRICDQQEAMPRNLPKLVKALWQLWREAHPEKMAWEHVQCSAPGCENGYIFVQGPDGYSSVAYCDRCAVTRRICRPGSPNLGNLADLEARGFSHQPKVRPEGGQIRANPRQAASLASGIGVGMGDVEIGPSWAGDRMG